ncbi:uncharacterized protein LOC115624217 [Scaptodrosophila lebanonensis]|uniref:Uncharacterized protein LOC115624217 n=1 Tax=Drosophila lebanonensis TaxID=7225 RepID=A0A6J2TD24_DROLE|nr:uncharacterized protein LOC115624217 [Scaptodrosophila lebanonensis]
MNYVIQRGKVRQQAINVPEGLPELLSDITREVLRCQPTKECLCQFIIDYLHSVIVTREKAMVAKSILDRALIKVDSIISDLCICDLSKEKTDIMAQVMEDCFRNFLEKRRCEMRRGKQLVTFQDLDLLEELLKKCNFTDDEMAMSRPAIDSAYKRFVEAYMAAAEGTQGTEILYEYFRDRELKRIEERMRHEAATTIQAAWRGYRVRSAMPVHVCTCTCMMEDVVDEEDLRRDRAARIIQRFFRSTLIREKEKLKIDPCEERPSLPTTIETDQVAQPEKTDTAVPSVVAFAPDTIGGPEEGKPEEGAEDEAAAEVQPGSQHDSHAGTQPPSQHESHHEPEPQSEAHPDSEPPPPPAEEASHEAEPPAAEEEPPVAAEESAAEAPPAEEPAPEAPPEE